MRFAALAFAALLALPLAGCGGLKDTSATGTATAGPSQETVDALTASLRTAADLGTIYVRLPICPQPTPCRTPGVAAKIGSTEAQANAMLQKYRAGQATYADVSAAIAALATLIPVKK